MLSPKQDIATDELPLAHPLLQLSLRAADEQKLKRLLKFLLRKRNRSPMEQLAYEGATCDTVRAWGSRAALDHAASLVVNIQ